jgi:hypothetical protein
MNLPKFEAQLQEFAQGDGTPELSRVKETLRIIEDLSNLKNLRAQGDSPELLHALQIFRPTQCQDPRDKLYAPLGLTHVTIIAQISPNYSPNNTHLKTYLQVIQYQISRKGHEFDSLGYVREASDPHWPSWIPNWSDGVAVRPLEKNLHLQKNPYGRSVQLYDKRNHTDDRTLAKIRMYNAGTDCAINAATTFPTLSVQGFVYDVISEIALGDHLVADSAAISPDANIGLRRNISFVFQKYVQAGKEASGLTSLVPLARTIIAGAKFNQIGQAVARNAIFDYELYQNARNTTSEEDENRAVNQLIAAYYALSGRKVARTSGTFENGQRFALVPEHARPGDLTAVFLGGQVLYVIRPIPGSEAYTFIGEAYVDGLMDGEALRCAVLARLKVWGG